MLRPTTAIAAALLASLTILWLLTDLADAQSGLIAETASVDGVTLTITFSEELTSTSSAVASDFTVKLGGESRTVSSASINGTDVALTLMEAVPDVDCTDQDVTVSYSAVGSTLTGSSGTVAAFMDQAVTNSTDAAPQIDSIQTDSTGRYIYVTFCEEITAFGAQWSDFSAFTIQRDSTRVPVNDLRRLSDMPTRLRLDLTNNRSRVIREGEMVTVAYDSSKANEDDPFGDANQGNKLVESWSARSVTNNVDSPPTLKSVSALYDIVTLTFSEALDEDSVPDGDAFTIGGVQHAPSVDDVAISGDIVTLTTSSILHNTNTPTYTLSYSEPNQSPLRQLDGAHNVADISSFQFQSSTPTARPKVKEAEVDGATLTITFDLPLKAVAPASAFTVAGEDGITVSATSYSGSVVTLTLSPAVSTGSTITVSYTVPDAPPRVEGRNTRDAEAFSGQSVTNSTAAPAPAFSQATVSADGTELTISFSLALDTTSDGLPDKSTFSLSGTSGSVESVSISGSSVSLTLSPIADINETITVSYAPPSDATAARLQSSAHSKAAETFLNKAVTNNADGKPRPVSAVVDGDEVVIGFDRNLDDQSEPATSAFAIGGVTATVSDVAISGKSLTLTISSAVTHVDTITVDYTSPMEMPLKRDGSSLLVDSFSGQSVTNDTGDPTPTFDSASVDATGRTLTIVMSHPLLATSAGIPAASTFSLGGTTGAAIDSVSISDSTILLDLDPAADISETATISYTPPDNSADPALQSAQGGWKTAAWSNESVTNNADGVPRLLGGSGNADSLVLEFDRALDDSSVPPKTDFSVTPTGKTVSGVDVDGASVTLTLSEPLAYGDEVSVSYSATGSMKLRRDGSTLEVAAFSGIEIENETPEPLLRSVVGDETTILLTFTKTLDTMVMPDATAFSLGADQPTVTAVTLASTTVALTLGRALQEGTEYTLTYTVPMTSPLTTSDSSTVPAFSEPVTNNTDVAPTALSATGDGSTVSIEFEQSLDSGSAVAADLFSITADSEVSVSAVSFDDDSLDLTLSRALAEDEVASIIYSKPTLAGIADSSDNRTDSFTLAIDNQTDTAPVPVSGVIEDDTITIILDQALYADPRFSPLAEGSVVYDHFTLSGTDADVTEIEISNGGPGGVGKIVLTLSEAVNEGDSLTLRYLPSTGNIPIRDDDAGQNRAEINNYPLKNLTDHPPVVESATLDGKTLVVTFDQELDANSIPDKTAFSLSDDGPAVASLTIDAEALTLTLVSTAIEDAEYTLSYTAPLMDGLSDGTGNDVVDFTQMVENTTDYAPSVDAITTNKSGTAVFVAFDQAINIPNSFRASSFSFDSNIVIHSVDIDPDVIGNIQLKFDLSEETPIREGAEVTLSYEQPETGGLHDDSGNLVDSFSKPVDNLVDVSPALAKDSEGKEKVTVSGYVLTIEFDQALDPEHVPPANCGQLENETVRNACNENPNITWFEVYRGVSTRIELESIGVANNIVTLGLKKRVARDDSIRVIYSPESLDGGRWNLRDTSPDWNPVLTFDPVDAMNVTPAHPSSVEFDRKMSSQIVIEFDGPLPDEGLSLGPWISVLAGQSSLGIDRIDVQGSTLAIGLSTTVPECVDVRIEYSSEVGDWVDGLGRAIDSFSLPVDNFINVDWKLRCIESDFGRVILTFASKNDIGIGPGHQWELTVNGEDREVAVTQDEDKPKVTLTPAPSVCAGDTIGIRPSSMAPREHRQPISRAAPCAVSAVADGVTLTVTFDSALDGAVPATADFTMSGEVTVEAIDGIAGTVLTLRLSSPGIRAGQETVLSYSGSNLMGGGLTVGPFAVEISDHTAPPELESAYGIGSSIFLTFDQPLFPRDIPASRFILSGPGLDQQVKTVSVGGSSVYLELTSRLRDEPDLFGLVYLAGSRGGLAGLTGSRVGDSVFIVQNYTETPPSVLSAVANGLRLKVTFDQRIEANGALPSDFVVVAGRRTIAVESLAWSESGVILRLAERVTSLDAVALLYSPGEGREVRDRAQNTLAEFRFWAENETPKPKTLQEKVEGARLRASGETSLERELVRGFASGEGMRVNVAAGDGWTSAARGRLKAMVDAGGIGDGPTRIHVAPIDDLSAMLEHFPSVPPSCWHGEPEDGISAWWVGESDLPGVPTDLGVRVRLVGAFDGFHAVSVCVLDLITGKWRPFAAGRPIVGPAFILIREMPYGLNWDRLPLAG